MDETDEFDWVERAELETATDDELIDQVMTLQQHVSTLQSDLDDLRELVYLLMDLQAGFPPNSHPGLAELLDRTDIDALPAEEDHDSPLNE